MTEFPHEAPPPLFHCEVCDDDAATAPTIVIARWQDMHVCTDCLATHAALVKDGWFGNDDTPLSGWDLDSDPTKENMMTIRTPSSTDPHALDSALRHLRLVGTLCNPDEVLDDERRAQLGTLLAALQIQAERATHREAGYALAGLAALLQVGDGLDPHRGELSALLLLLLDDLDQALAGAEAR